MVSKAAERSRRQRQVTCFLQMALIMELCSESRTASVERNVVYADWKELKRELEFKCRDRLSLTMRSVYFDRNDKFEIGL